MDSAIKVNLDALLALANAARSRVQERYRGVMSDDVEALADAVKALIERQRAAENEADAAIKNQAFERARADQNAKAFEQAEAGAAQLREALEWYATLPYMEEGGLHANQHNPNIAIAALASTPTGSRVLERLKAAEDIIPMADHLIMYCPSHDFRQRLEAKLEAWRKLASEADRG